MNDLSEKVAAVPATLPALERAWAAVNLSLRGRVKRQKNGCWYFMGFRAKGRKNRRGYGRIRVDGRKQYAHRIAYEAVNDPIEPGWHVHHLCGNPPCVNPAHLDQLMPHLNGLEQTLRNGHRPCLHPNPRRNSSRNCVECQREYSRRPDVRARKYAARRTPEFRARENVARRTPEARARRSAALRRPEARARHNEYMRRRRARKRLEREGLESVLLALAFQS